jgi:hypothetical protein
MIRKPLKEKAKKATKKESDDFISVARRLGADEDRATFEAKLAKIVKAPIQNAQKKTR